MLEPDAVPWYKRLRWRLIGSQFLVALVGVTLILLVTQYVVGVVAPSWLRTLLQPFIPRVDLATVETELLLGFQTAVWLSVFVAALGALLAGAVSSYMLWRVIIRPLQDVAETSRRIADGRYNERVAIPTDNGEAMQGLAISFNQMAEALERVENQRVALLGNLAHELRTPLTSLKGYLEGVVDGIFPSDVQTFDLMTAEVTRLSRLVSDIQHLSNVEAGQIRLVMQPFVLQTKIEAVITQLSPQAQAKQIRLQLEAPSDPVYVLADSDRTAQVLINLLNNAIQYTPEAGGIVVRVLVQGTMVQTAVIDTGDGIPSDALPYLFERFYRVDRSRSRKSGGSGIGLTIARHLTWAMGGELTARSDGKGQGSTFAFTLPLAR